MELGDGDLKQYSGMDYNLLTTIAKALNFTFSILPSNNWREVSVLNLLPEMQLNVAIVLIRPSHENFLEFY